MSQNGPIILVEDDPDDIEIYEMILDEFGLKNRLMVFGNPVLALEYLKKMNGDAETRLRFAFQVARTLSEQDSPAVVQAWLTGVNPELGEQSATAPDARQ